MKRYRPFLALLLACCLLVLPALADDEVDGPDGGAPSVSDAVEDSGPSASEEAPPPVEEAPEPEVPPEPEAPPEPEDPEEAPPPPADDTAPFPPDTPPDTEDTPPVAEDAPPDTGADPVGPEAPATPETPAGTIPETPVAPAPETPAPENPAPSAPTAVPGTPGDPLPAYPVPDTSLIAPGLQEVPGTAYGTLEDAAPSANAVPQVFTITTIPEFALAALESDYGDTLSQSIRSMFGTYKPKIQTVTTYVDGEITAIEEQYVPGVAGMDWEWIAGVVLFTIVLWSFFKLVGVFFKHV